MVGCHRHGESQSHLSDYQLVKGLAHGVFVLEDVSGRSVGRSHTTLCQLPWWGWWELVTETPKEHKVLPETCIKSRRCGSTTKRIMWCEVFSAGWCWWKGRKQLLGRFISCRIDQSSSRSRHSSFTVGVNYGSQHAFSVQRNLSDCFVKCTSQGISAGRWGSGSQPVVRGVLL